jgi:dolichyl-phosphate beta-glucosyltransferase
MLTTLVIPAYNEADRLADGYRRLAPVLEALGPDQVEVILVDDGSRDATLEVARDVYAHLPHRLVVSQPTNRGKGAAVRLGLGLASGSRVAVLDADMAIDPECLPDILHHLDGADLAPGSRARNGVVRYDSRLRTLSGAVFNRLVRHYAGTTVRDSQCGAKGLRLGPARILAALARVDGFAYDVEFLYLARQLGLTSDPVPVTWRDVRGSSVRLGHDSLAMVRDLRGLRRVTYANPAVVLDAHVALGDVEDAARDTRALGPVLARGDRDAVVVLRRDDALAAVTVAQRLAGRVTTVGVHDLRGRTFDALLLTR